MIISTVLKDMSEDRINNCVAGETQVTTGCKERRMAWEEVTQNLLSLQRAALLQFG